MSSGKKQKVAPVSEFIDGLHYVTMPRLPILANTGVYVKIEDGVAKMSLVDFSKLIQGGSFSYVGVLADSISKG